MSDIVEFRHLKYIVAVAETGNFTRAAERLFVSQPSLSKQIKDIEEEIGFPVFERTREGVIATPVGQMVVDYAIATLHGRRLTFSLAKEIFLGKIPSLRLGFSSFVNSRHLQAFRASYLKHFPNCGLQFSGGDAVHVLERIERGDLDCAVLPLPVAGKNWIVHQIASARLVACMRADDALADQSEITLNDLVKRLTVFRDPDGYPAAHARLLQMFGEAGHNVNISSSAAAPSDIQLLVRDGFGIALVNEDMPLENDITTRRVSGVHWTADTAFVYAADATHPALAHIVRSVFGKNPVPPRNESKSERPQLALRFDVIAS